jgi:hypothetical protein
MHIASLMSSPEKPERRDERKRSYDAMAKDDDKEREKDPGAAAAFYNQLQRRAR